MEWVVLEQREDCAVVGQQTSCYVDHPLTLLVGLCENMDAKVIVFKANTVLTLHAPCHQETVDEYSKLQCSSELAYRSFK